MKLVSWNTNGLRSCLKHGDRVFRSGNPAAADDRNADASHDIPDKTQRKR